MPDPTLLATGKEVEAIYAKWAALEAEINALPGLNGDLKDASEIWSRVEV